MKANRWLGLALSLCTLVLLLMTAGDYGLTYDEPVYSSRAMRAGEWLGLVFTAPSIAFERGTIDRLWDATGDEQAGLMKLIAWPASLLASPFVPALAAVRAATAFVVAGFVGLMFTFLANVRGRLEALFACLGLVFLPRVFADMHLLTMDAPVMAFSMLAVMAGWLASRHEGGERRGGGEASPPGPLSLQERGRTTSSPSGLPSSQEMGSHWLWIAMLGLSFGAAIACKANGWFVPVIVLPWLIVYRRRAFLPVMISMAVLGPLVFIATWPWLWFDTVARMARYFSFFVKHYPVGVEYFGHVYNNAPWHYALVMLAVTTPVVVLGLAAVGVGKLLNRSRGVSGGTPDGGPANGRDNGGGVRAPALQHGTALLLLMFWAVVVNLVPVLLPSSPKYNGVRLFLPIFPPLMVLAAGGFGWMARGLAARLTKDLRERRLVLALLLLLALLPQVYTTMQVHPFGMSYYNMLIGGLHGAAAKGMEPTYWGDAFYAAAPWLNEHAPQGAEVWLSVPGFVSSMRIYQQFGLLRPDLQLTGGREAFYGADLYLVMNKPTELGDLGKEIVGAGKALYVKELDSVPLVWVFGPYK